ncbi:hypothetical protein DB30_03482 [Enhygromyxa salina]|uniref:Lipoprotein n=1 Tax=Enhygromyxa salina TaxID=215803 RepID=A0A0C1ZID8_9BACT|nr:hypothetical protein [Enhygromyxa salina]KIG17299.1 hypothetical protein DB30_03482 [Enhygromyxa salina]
MQRISSIALTMTVLTAVACTSREDRMRQQMAFDSMTPDPDGKTADDVPKIPPHPTRDALEPVLSLLYAADSLPAVQEADDAVAEGQDFAITNPGVLAIVNIRSGTSKGEQAKAIIRGVAEADAFAVRNDAELYFPEQLNKIKYAFSPEERDLIRVVYGDLRLLDFFSSEGADAAIGALDGELKTAATELKDDYLARKDEIWDSWMGVKMYARRVVAYDQPFKPVLRNLRKTFEMKEPEPITWEAAHDPEFASWAKTINGDDTLFKMFNNLDKLREQEEFRGDTHARWAMQGSSLIPEGIKVKPEDELGFGIHREDLGGGYQEITFVFDKKLRGDALREAYLRSLIYRQVFSDFATLSAAGGDFEGGQVPDENDADYAYCASRMALDGAINDFADAQPLLAGLKSTETNEDKLVTVAVECVLDRIPKGINRGVEGDDARPPAMHTRTALFQMLARFTKVDVNLDNMKKDVEKSAEVEDAEAFLKAYDKKKRGR